MNATENKVIIITGAGSGSGDAVAYAVSQPEDASVNEITVRASAQEF